MAASAHFRRACIIDLQAGLFGYTVAFTGSTLSAMISATDLCPTDDLVDRCQLRFSVWDFGIAIT